jgi:hypothetical protein
MIRTVRLAPERVLPVAGFCGSGVGDAIKEEWC